MKPPTVSQNPIELNNALQAAETRIIELTDANAQLESARQDMAALYRFSQSLIEFEKLEDALQKTVDFLAETLGFDRVNLITFDLQKEAVQNICRGGQGRHNVVDVPIAELKEGLSGWVLETGEPALSPKDIPDARESPAVQRRRQETECGAIIVVPLAFQGRVLGTLTVINRPEQRDLNGRDVDMLMSLTSQVATMMENHRLYQAMSAEVRERQRMQLELEKAYFDQERRIHERISELREKNKALEQEIEARQQIEAALQEREQKFNLLLNILPMGVAILNAERKVVFSNSALQKIVRMDNDGLADGLYKDRKYLASDGTPLPVDSLASAQVLKSGQPIYDFETGILIENGETIWTSVSAVPVDFPDWKVIVATTDITRRKSIEEALRQSQDNFSRAFKSNPVALLITRPEDGRVVNVNEAFTNILGYEPEEALGRTVIDLNIYINPDERTHLIQQLRERGRLQNYEMQVRNKSGNLSRILASIETILYDGEERFLATFIDITSRKQMEEELRRSNSDLEQFAYIASHDLQEPLRAISGMVQLLGQRYKGQLDERADEYIAHTVEAASRMQALINDLLVYSRVDRRGNERAPVDLTKCLKSALSNLSVTIQENHATVTYDALPTIQADVSQMTQLFQNLIGNGIKFRGKAEPQIHIHAQQVGNTWQFSVRDNGIGIEPQYFERIFQIFQRLHTRRAYTGTGIGLAICKKIVERHGGLIWVESEPGRGSIFHFTLPFRSQV